MEHTRYDCLSNNHETHEPEISHFNRTDDITQLKIFSRKRILTKLLPSFTYVLGG